MAYSHTDRRIIGVGATKMSAIKRAMGMAYSHTDRRIIGVGATKMSAIKRAMGMAYSHTVFVSQIVDFLRANPDFRTARPETPRRRARGTTVRPPGRTTDGTAD
jgi:hypothetical protein